LKDKQTYKGKKKLLVAQKKPVWLVRQNWLNKPKLLVVVKKLLALPLQKLLLVEKPSVLQQSKLVCNRKDKLSKLV
jgi:hypothetical protein